MTLSRILQIQYRFEIDEEQVNPALCFSTIREVVMRPAQKDPEEKQVHSVRDSILGVR